MAGPLVGGGDPGKSATAQARAAALVGRTISDRYRIVELVAMGAMGAVYRGEHLLMRKRVAIKVLHPEIEDFPELVARFEREAIAGAHVNHPNVASASDFGKFDGDSYFLVLEYIEGITLSDVIAEGLVEPLRAAIIVRQLAAALGAAHQRGIVHRDVKPRNIMICEPSILETSARGGDDEIVKLIDFGLAKVPVEKLSNVAQDPVADGKELTNAGVVMGTVSYMAPETALGMGAVQAKADFYAVGVIFYEMLAGKHMFDETEPQKIFAAHCTLTPPPFALRNPSARVPADLEAIVMRLLEKDPSNRYPDAESLMAAIDAFKMRVKLAGTLSIKRPVLPPPKPRSEPDAAPGSSGSSGLYVPKRTVLKRGLEGPALWVVFAVAVAAIVAIAIFAFSRIIAEDPSTATSARPTSEPSATSQPTTARTTPRSARPIASLDPSAPVSATAPGASGAAQALRAAIKEEPSAAARSAIAIFDSQPDALKEPTAQSAAAAVAERVAEADALTAEADAIFDRLATKLGEPGLDVLYEIAAKGDQSKGGVRAKALLDRPDIFQKGSTGLKIAYDLKRMACDRRPFLFPRAAKEGDDRSLVILTSMTPPACEPRVSPCCYLKHGELDRAVTEIRSRIRK